MGGYESVAGRLIAKSSPLGVGLGLDPVNPFREAPQGYVTGCTLVPRSPAPDAVTIQAGLTRSANDAFSFLHPGFLVKTTGVWAAGNGAGGLFSGSIAPNTWYHVFLIRKDSDGSLDGGFDTDITAASRPAGYGTYRWLGSVRTDGSNNFIAFTQLGPWFTWNTPILDIDTALLGTTPTNFVLSVPPGIRGMALLNVQVNNAGGLSAVYLRSPEQTDLDPSISIAPLSTIKVQVNGVPASGMVFTSFDLARTVRATASMASTSFTGATVAWWMSNL